MPYLHRHLNTPLRVGWYTLPQFLVGMVWVMGLLFFGRVVLSFWSLLCVWGMTCCMGLALGLMQRKRPEKHLRNVVVYTLKKGAWYV